MNRIPINGSFELTARCNLSCSMCYVRVDNNKIKQLGVREKTAQEWIDIAKQVFDAGTLKLLITGGEPMLRPDFCEIYEAIYKMGFIITLYTNATLINDKVMDILRKYPPHQIGVTVYGASEETYKNVCKDANAYNKMLEGLSKLITLPSKIEIRTTVIKDNIEEIKKIEEFANNIKTKNIKFVLNDKVFNSVRGGIADPTKVRLSPKENALKYCNRYVEVVNKYINDESYKKQIKQITDIKKEHDKNKNNEQKRNTFYGCEAGISDYHITWDGKLIPCALMGKYFTNPFDEGFAKAWDRLEDVIVLPSIPNDCISCKYNKFCGTCAASRFAETGDENGIPEYLCEEAKAFYDIFNK